MEAAGWKSTLDGTLRAAQAYTDRITRSEWWRRVCPPSWMGDHSTDSGWKNPLNLAVPQRVMVDRSLTDTTSHAFTDEVYYYRGKYYPYIRIARLHIKSEWVIVHELAHIMAVGFPKERGHGKWFAGLLHAAVERWIGTEAADYLDQAYEDFNIPVVWPSNLTRLSLAG